MLGKGYTIRDLQFVEPRLYGSLIISHVTPSFTVWFSEIALPLRIDWAQGISCFHPWVVNTAAALTGQGTTCSLHTLRRMIRYLLYSRTTLGFRPRISDTLAEEIIEQSSCLNRASPSALCYDNSTFSRSKAWTTLNSQNLTVPWHRSIWPMWHISWALFISWLTVEDRPSIKACLAQWDVLTETHYEFCHCSPETRDPLFFTCRITDAEVSSNP